MNITGLKKQLAKVKGQIKSEGKFGYRIKKLTGRKIRIAAAIKFRQEQNKKKK